MHGLVAYGDDDEEYGSSGSEGRTQSERRPSLNVSRRKRARAEGSVGYDSASERENGVNQKSAVERDDGYTQEGLSSLSMTTPVSAARTKSQGSSQRLGAIVRKPLHRPATLRRRSPPLESQINSSTPERAPSPPASVSPGTRPASIQDSDTPGAEGAEGSRRLRALLHPPPIAGLEDWGIPPAADPANCDPTLAAQLAEFARLKCGSTGDDGQSVQVPRHFNDSLMGSRAFRNPHLYARLVDFVDVDECTSNFPRNIWDPHDVRPEWFAESIAEQQKRAEEKRAASQTGGKRSRIDFAPSSSTSTGNARIGTLGGGTGFGRGRGTAANRYLTVSRNDIGAGGQGRGARW